MLLRLAILRLTDGLSYRDLLTARSVFGMGQMAIKWMFFVVTPNGSNAFDSRWMESTLWLPLSIARYSMSSQESRVLIQLQMCIWETKSVAAGKQCAPIKTIDSHLDAVLDFALYRNTYIVSASRDRTIRLFDFSSGKELQYHTMGNSRWGTSVCFSRCGKLFAVALSDFNIDIFNVKDGRRLRHIRIFNIGIVSVRFPNKENPRFLVVGTSEGFLQKIYI